MRPRVGATNRVAAAHGCQTPRSSRAPTAGHQARHTGTKYIFCVPGLASHRWVRLSSTVRPSRRRPAQSVAALLPVHAEIRTSASPVGAPTTAKPEPPRTPCRQVARTRRHRRQGAAFARVTPEFRCRHSPSHELPQATVHSPGPPNPERASHRDSGDVAHKNQRR